LVLRDLGQHVLTHGHLARLVVVKGFDHQLAADDELIREGSCSSVRSCRKRQVELVLPQPLAVLRPLCATVSPNSFTPITGCRRRSVCWLSAGGGTACEHDR